MAHEWDTCSCVLCLSFRRIFNLLYTEEASGLFNGRAWSCCEWSTPSSWTSRKGERLRLPPQPLPVSRVGDTGSKGVKQEPTSEEKENVDEPDKAKPVETPVEKGETSPSKDRAPDTCGEKASEDTGEGASTARESAPSKKERTRSSRDREHRRRRDREEEVTEGADKRPRSRHRRRQRRASSKAKSPEKGQPENHSLPKEQGEGFQGQEVPPYTSPEPGPPLATGIIAIPSIQSHQRSEKSDPSSTKAAASSSPQRAGLSICGVFQLG